VSGSVGFTGFGARFACYPVSDPQRIAWSGETKAVHGDGGNLPGVGRHVYRRRTDLGRADLVKSCRMSQCQKASFRSIAGQMVPGCVL